MPHKNGHECLQDIRSDFRFMNVPVVIMTTSLDERNIKAAFEKGASLYLKKPTTFTQHINVLKEILVLYQKKELLRRPKHHFVIPPDLKLI